MRRRSGLIGAVLIAAGTGLIISTLFSGALSFILGLVLVIVGICILYRC